MAPWGGFAGIARVTQSCGGLWRFLIVWSKGRTAIELERERNRATAEVVQLLSSGDELLEYEPNGRLRVIRKSGAPVTAPTMADQLLDKPSDEVD